jgi:hypothetical protein
MGVSAPAALSRPLAEYAPAALYNGWKLAAGVKNILVTEEEGTAIRPVPGIRIPRAQTYSKR